MIKQKDQKIIEAIESYDQKFEYTKYMRDN